MSIKNDRALSSINRDRQLATALTSQAQRRVESRAHQHRQPVDGGVGENQMARGVHGTETETV